MPETTVAPERLAAGIVARLLHDLSGPASGILSGIDLLADTQMADLKADAAELAADSARRLLSMLEYFRAAYGATGEGSTAVELERLANTQFSSARSRLVWSLAAAELPRAASKALLLMVQLAAGGLPVGGEARLSGLATPDHHVLRVEGEGPKASLAGEVVLGLSGQASADGVQGRWAPAYVLFSTVGAAGGSTRWAQGAGAFLIEALIPIVSSPR